jgi:endonuclease III
MAALVDRQIPAERAWALPGGIRDRLGTFEIRDLAGLTEGDWMGLLTEPTPLHRFPPTMAIVLFRAVQRLVERYDGDASRIWAECPSSATVVRRILEFHGAGPKIATMVANILVRDFRVRLSDYRYIDISADVQVCRVMKRLGFVDTDASVDVVIYAAREASPDFPGVFDLALWELGRTICRPTTPACERCRFQDGCKFAESRSDAGVRD